MKRRLRLTSLFALIALLLLSSSFALAAPPADKVGGSPAADGGATGTFGMWTENFDSYTAGSGIAGQGGWITWGGTAAEDAFVDNAQSSSAPNSLRIDPPTDVVRVFDVTTGIQLLSGEVYIPTAFQGDTYLIFVNTFPATASAHWSAQLMISGATDTVISDEFGVTAPFTRGEWLPWELRVDLTTDTQTFTFDGTVMYSNQPWSNAGTPGGAVRLGAIDLFGNGATPVYYDNLMLMEEAGPTPTATVVPPTATVVPPTPTSPPTSIELGGISSSGSTPMGGWLISLLGLGLVAAGLIAKRRS